MMIERATVYGIAFKILDFCIFTSLFYEFYCLYMLVLCIEKVLLQGLKKMLS